MRKTVTTKFITMLMALVLIVTAVPMGNVAAEAATKPGAVTKITKSEVNPTTVTIQYNKVKNAKGYQIRAYKGKKLVKNTKTKNTSYTIKGLSAQTKYTIKVRAYNGSKYGKEKSVTVKTETKNLAVTSLKAAKVTSSSVKITYKKALNAKGYQIRVYKGSKQVANVKTKNTSYTVDKLSENTKYTVKVRAYKGSKYGKEKSVRVTTKTGSTTSENPEPENPTPPTPEPLGPGESVSEGEQLVAEYNAYVAYVANSWSNVAGTAHNMNDSSITCLNTAWLSYTGSILNLWKYSDAYTDKYQAFKHGCGTLDAITDYYADVLAACGLTVSFCDVTDHYNRYNQLYASDNNNKDYYDPRVHKGLLVTTQDGKTSLKVIGFGTNKNGLQTSMRDSASLVDGRTIVGICPGCGNQIRSWASLSNWQSDKNRNWIHCQTCKKGYYFTNPYKNTDLSQPIYIRTATSINCIVCGLNVAIGSGNNSPVDCPKCGGFLCYSCYMNGGLLNHECNP